MRVRLTLEKDGSFTLTESECEKPKNLTLPLKPSRDFSDLPRIGLSHEGVDSASCWVYHKTTNRELYDKEFASAQSQNLIDVIFCNEEGNVTEGCISNIIIYRNGTYYTPPVTDGLLVGVMRQYLIDNCPHPFQEQSLSTEDVRGAEAVFLCNSVRGLVQVTL